MAQTNAFIIVAQGVKNAIVALPNSGILYDPIRDEHKIYQGLAPGDYPTPYIRLNQIYGGDDNIAPGDFFDTTVRIDCVGSDLDMAIVGANLINTAVKGQLLNLIDGWSCWHPVRSVSDVHEPFLMQDNTYWCVGALYRFRASK